MSEAICVRAKAAIRISYERVAHAQFPRMAAGGS